VFRVQGLGVRVKGLGVRVNNLGVRVQHSCRVHDAGCTRRV
jgi:hypothetical protein